MLLLADPPYIQTANYYGRSPANGSAKRLEGASSVLSGSHSLPLSTNGSILILLYFIA